MELTKSQEDQILEEARNDWYDMKEIERLQNVDKED
jgi:hypothetical protein